jgi:hypothetical protein
MLWAMLTLNLLTLNLNKLTAAKLILYFKITKYFVCYLCFFMRFSANFVVKTS